jgi:hypothetical protein
MSEVNANFMFINSRLRSLLVFNKVNKITIMDGDKPTTRIGGSHEPKKECTTA